MANINVALAIAKVGIMEELRTVKVATKSELITIVGVITKDHLMELRVTGILRKLKSQGGQTSTASPSDLVDQATEVQLRVVIVTLCEMGLYVKKQVLASFGVLGRQPHKCRNCGKTFCHNENKAKSCHYHTGTLVAFKHRVDIFPPEARYWGCCGFLESCSGCKIQKHQT